MPRIEGHAGLDAREARLKGLLVRGLGGDEAAYHAFLRELSMHLRAFLRRRLTGLPDDIEDLVQESLLAVHNHRDTYDPAQPLTAWVHAIAKYKLVDLMRRRESRDHRTEPLDEKHEMFAIADADAADARRDVGNCSGNSPIASACRSFIRSSRACPSPRPRA